MISRKKMISKCFDGKISTREKYQNTLPGDPLRDYVRILVRIPGAPPPGIRILVRIPGGVKIS